jgi:hypothetical protein
MVFLIFEEGGRFQLDGRGRVSVTSSSVREFLCTATFIF